MDQVTSDPAVVFTFIALFAGAIVLALLLAVAFARRPDGAPDDPADVTPGARPRTLSPPWSTAPVCPGLARKASSKKAPIERD
jgi:hypothetical protein